MLNPMTIDNVEHPRSFDEPYDVSTKALLALIIGFVRQVHEHLVKVFRGESAFSPNGYLTGKREDGGHLPDQTFQVPIFNMLSSGVGGYEISELITEPLHEHGAMRFLFEYARAIRIDHFALSIQYIIIFHNVLADVVVVGLD